LHFFIALLEQTNRFRDSKSPDPVIEGARDRELIAQQLKFVDERNRVADPDELECFLSIGRANIDE